VLLAVFGVSYFCRADWTTLGKIIQQRANSDRAVSRANSDRSTAPTSPVAVQPGAVGSVAPLQAAAAGLGSDS